MIYRSGGNLLGKLSVGKVAKSTGGWVHGCWADAK